MSKLALTVIRSGRRLLLSANSYASFVTVRISEFRAFTFFNPSVPPRLTASCPHLLRLCPGLDDDAAPALDFDIQVVAVQHPHTHQGRGVGGVCQDVPWLVVPEHGNVVDIEGHLAPVSKSSPASALKRQSQLRRQRRSYGQESGPVSITASISLVCPDGPCTTRVTTGS